MAATDLTTRTVEQLEATLRKQRAVQRTVAVIFGIIIGAWVVLGYWKANLPVFITTVAVAVATTVSTAAASHGVARELKRRAEARTPE